MSCLIPDRRMNSFCGYWAAGRATRASRHELYKSPYLYYRGLQSPDLDFRGLQYSVSWRRKRGVSSRSSSTRAAARSLTSDHRLRIRDPQAHRRAAAAAVRVRRGAEEPALIEVAHLPQVSPSTARLSRTVHWFKPDHWFKPQPHRDNPHGVPRHWAEAADAEREGFVRGAASHR